MKEFDDIFEHNLWGSGESKSGEGSTLKATDVLREELVYILKRYKIKSILDAGCGDYNWMQSMDLKGIDYTGGDTVKSLIKSNKKKYPDVKFIDLDITKECSPKADLVLCRDVLGHLTNENVFRALENISNSGSKYLLTTTLTRWNFNADPTVDGGWRFINLLIKPFYLRPIHLINEDCQEGYPAYNDKCLILIDISKMFLEALAPMTPTEDLKEEPPPVNTSQDWGTRAHPVVV